MQCLDDSLQVRTYPQDCPAKHVHAHCAALAHTAQGVLMGLSAPAPPGGTSTAAFAGAEVPVVSPALASELAIHTSAPTAEPASLSKGTSCHSAGLDPVPCSAQPPSPANVSLCTPMPAPDVMPAIAPALVETPGPAQLQMPAPPQMCALPSGMVSGLSLTPASVKQAHAHPAAAAPAALEQSERLARHMRMWRDIIMVDLSPGGMLAKLKSAHRMFWQQFDDSRRDMLEEQWRPCVARAEATPAAMSCCSTSCQVCVALHWPYPRKCWRDSSWLRQMARLLCHSSGLVKSWLGYR